MFLMETQHNTDSVVIRRLCADGYQVVDRPRPRSRTDTFISNHGGVAAAATPGMCLTLLDLSTEPASCELLPVRVVSKSSPCVVVVIYHTGSLTTVFCSEYSDVMDHVTTNIEPLYIVGDMNIHLNRADDPWSRQLIDLLASYVLSLHVLAPMHDRGRLLDVVGSRDDLPAPSVDVIDFGLTISYSGGQCRRSDHHLFTRRQSVDHGAS